MSHPDSRNAKTHETSCCVVGAGPAGVVLSLLLARAGVSVTLLEAHKDFDRDFRGDTLHPSTLELMQELGLAEELLQIPHAKLRKFGFQTPTEYLTVADFGKLKTQFPFVAMMPQVHFLEFLTNRAKQYPSFQLVMGANVQDLVEENGIYRGVRYHTGDGTHEVQANLVIAADGRFSRLRNEAGLEPVKTSPPMDVLWFRLPRRPSDQLGTMFRVSGGRFLVVLERQDDWQLGYVILKGSYREVREAGIGQLQESIAELAPEFGDRVGQIDDWKQIAPLSVESSRLAKWYLPGLLFIGDAAHVMSPVGGVGINYEIQDSVAAANVLTDRFKAGEVRGCDLAEIQRQRYFPTRVIQAFQTVVQNRIIRQALKPKARFTIPLFMRLPGLKTLPARLIAFGIRRAHLSSSLRDESADVRTASTKRT
jgi:2-polyprenyl-6-methoxyphenol hydroxylase-like FAD-dependent oxidoreductase